MANRKNVVPTSATVDSIQQLVPAAPGTSDLAMMLIGFVGIGFVAYRRQGKNAALTPRFYHRMRRLIVLMTRAVSMVSLARAPCR